MNPISLEEQKKIQLEILSYFADFCDKNGLKYYLAYGTLLGAVRHKGFIPWDDDIDICMPMSDYEQAIKLFNSVSHQSNYELIPPTDPIARHPYVKIIDKRTVKFETPVSYKHGHLGVDIDIFYMDGEPEDEEEFKVWCSKFTQTVRKYTNKVLKIWHSSPKTTLKVMLLKLQSPHSRDYYFEKSQALHKPYSYENSKYVGYVCGAFQDNFRNRFEKEWFSESVKLEFEGRLFNAPIDYHKVLTTLYGDYMTPPPAAAQITHHSSDSFWKDERQEV